MRHAHQRGVALLIAIVMFAIATTVAAAITYNKAMAARRAAATFTMEEALQAGMAAEALASIVLESDGSKSKTEFTQDWAQPLGPVEIEGTGVWIQAQLEDISGRFNLNSLVKFDAPTNSFVADTEQLERFRTLLGELDVDLKYADLLLDWIDSDLAPQASQGGEDTLYLSQVPPYRPPNTFISHPSELLALPGFGKDNYGKLAQFVTTLPLDALLNVCTASGQVLDATLRTSQSQFASANLKQDRSKGCFPEKAAYLAPISDPTLKTEVAKRIDEKSSWFRLRTNIRIGTAEFVLYSVLFRETTNKVRAVQRNFGSE